MTARVEEYEATTDEAAEALYDLTAFWSAWSDERIEANGRALGEDGLDVDKHQRACSITANLRALRATAIAIFYLLPEKDEAEFECGVGDD